MAPPNCLLQIDSTRHYDWFSTEHVVEFVLLVVAAVIATKIDWVLMLPIKLFTYLNKLGKKEVKSIWKFSVKSSEIKSGNHFNISSFKKAFFERESFKSARKKFIIEKKNLILTGRSGLGKTRSAFEILSKSKAKFKILIPFLTRPDNFDFKVSFERRKHVVLFIDDLQNYNIIDINYYLENLLPHSSSVQLLCTCRTEHEEKIFSSFQIPDVERFYLDEWNENEGQILAALLNIPFNSKTFDHTAASLLYKLEKLKEQYKQLTKNQKAILESIKFLKLSSLECNSGTVKDVAEKVFDCTKDLLSYNSWKTEFKKLMTIGFYDINSKGEIIINEIYLSELIELNFLSAFNRYFKLAKEKNDSGALFYLGWYFESIGNFPSSEKCYKEAIAIYPNYGSAYYRLGSLYLAKADREENQLLLKTAIISITSSIKFLQCSVELKPQDYSYFVTLGYANSKAASVYDKLFNKSSEIQKLNDAILNFSKAIELNIQNSGAYRMRGFCYFQLKDYENAQKDYITAISINPNSHHAYYLLGLVFSELGDEEKSLQNYRQCILLKRNFYQAYNNIGHTLAKKLKDSDLSFKEGNKVAGESIRSYLLAIWYSRGEYPVAYSNLAHIYIDRYQFEKAIKVQSITIKKSPNYSEAYASRAYAYNRIGKYDLAEKDLLKALELQPQSQNKLIHSLAFCYQQMAMEKMKIEGLGNAKAVFKKAISYYDKLENISDENLRTSAKLGKAITLEKLGEKEKAFDILTALFADNSSNKKILSSIFIHLKTTDNDEQILNFLLVLLEAVNEKKIKNISSQLMEECTLQIQRLSKIKLLSNHLRELLEVLKATFPDSYFVFKTAGIYNLNKAIVQPDFKIKMNLLSQSENDFNFGKKLTKNNPVFQKYIGIVNSKRAIALKEKYKQTMQEEDLISYNNQFAITQMGFADAEKDFPNYPELFVEHAVFLYSNENLILAKTIEKQARDLLSMQVENNQKNDKQVKDELKELEEIKLRFEHKEQ